MLASLITKVREKRKLARRATITALAISNTLSISFLRSNALQIRHSHITSLAITYIAKARR